jgi:hypothetical protein
MSTRQINPISKGNTRPKATRHARNVQHETSSDKFRPQTSAAPGDSHNNFEGKPKDD